MKVITKASEKFLFEYINATSPTGFEVEGQKVWTNYIKSFVDEVHLDTYGTAHGVINPGQDYKVVIEAHADEISWFVNYISDDGYISVIRNGGSDHIIAPSKKVTIHTPKGPVKGVFGWPAIHVRNGKDANLTPSLKNIFIDVGAADKAEVIKKGIHVGCVITFDEQLDHLNDRYFIGKALDNKMGGFCIAEVARLIKKNKIKLPFTLHVVNAVQEEIGLRGAEMIAQRIKPDVAIITDVTHDTASPLMKAKEQGDIKAGAGPVLTYAPAVHNKLLQLIIDAAEKSKIPFQRSAASRSTGTDTDAFAYSNQGVASALISLPLKYMHTTVEMAHKEDIENVTLLIYESLMSIEKDHNFKYF